MKKYSFILWTVDFIHLLVIIFWVSGFFVPIDLYPLYRTVHTIFGNVMVVAQVIVSCRCPLVLVSGYFRKMANPEFGKNSMIFEPFIVGFLKKRLGFNVHDILITIIVIIGVAVSIITVLSYFSLKQ